MTRLVLGEAVSDDVLDDARLALGLQLVNVTPATRSTPAQLQFLSRDRRSLIAVVDDAQLDVTYLALAAPSPAELSALAAELAATLPVLDEGAVDALLAGATPSDLARGLAAAALSSAESASRSARFVAALGHSAREIRVRAVVAAAYARWPSLRAPLAEIARADGDAGVRTLATNALAAFPPDARVQGST